MAKEIDPQILRKLLRYEPETGKLYWLERPREFFGSDRLWRSWNTRYAGQEAFTADNGVGYRIGSIFGRHHLAHRVGWAIVHGQYPVVTDHINGDRSDNRLCNLRSIEGWQNALNSRLHARNTSGHVGVTWHAPAQKWAAQLSYRGKAKFLGLFATKEEAIAARSSASAEYGFHPNHGRTAA